MNTVSDYLSQVAPDKKDTFEKLYQVISKNLPKGFEATIQYKMISFVVPLKTYPPGYHCAADTPLPFISLAAQKNFIALYHMGIYADEKLYQWFTNEYPKHSSTKLDMGKSCIRFKKVNDIPLDLIAELVSKISPKQWIEQYEKAFKK
ncbi:MAG: DUF1801 domain-containing protein [Cytophagaceae bacterium]